VVVEEQRALKVVVCTQMFPNNPSEALISGMIKNPYYQTVFSSRVGVDVKVITTGVDSWRKSVNGINVHSIGDAPFKGVVRAFVYEFKMSLSLIGQIINYKPDIIHIHHLNLPLIAILKCIGIVKSKLIYTAHGTSTPELKAAVQGSRIKYQLLKINGLVQHYLDKFCWHQADLLLSPSAFQIDEMRTLYNVETKNISVVYNGFDPSIYYPSVDLRRNIRENLQLDNDNSLIVFVGRAAKKKGIEYLISVADRLYERNDKIRLLIVIGYMGRQTEYRDKIKKMALERNYIIYKESVPESDMCGYYNAADLCVFPSIGYESIPTVIYEAMACGKAILTQGAWGIPEVLAGEYITEQEIINANFSEKISTLLDDKTKLLELGKVNIENSRDYSWKIGGLRLKVLYEELLTK
jgi:glycosyltransferase involved in cell wall biosynthesis